MLEWIDQADAEDSQKVTVPSPATAPRASRFRHASRPLLSRRYVLLEEIGRGGVGIVYLAWDLVLHQAVAIKTLRPSETDSKQRIDGLKKEAALQMRLAHDGIVRLFHFEPSESSVGAYLIMEYVSWTPGDRWIAEAGPGGLPPAAVLTVGVKLCDALACAHDAGVLHLDVKPSNIFIDSSGERTKLADFGIATVLGPRQQGALVTNLMGTPAYMAPEQKVRGEKIGPRTDVYLLAATLWECITGEKPGDGSRSVPRDPTTAAALAVLLQALAPTPDQRPADMRMFGSLLSGARC